MPLGEGVFIHQRHLDIVPIEEHATHLFTHPGDFGLDSAAISEMNLRPDLEQDREVLIIAAGMNGWARARSHKGEIHCEMWGPWHLAPAIASKITDHFGAGPFTLLFLNNLRHKAGFSCYVEQISGKSDKEMEAMAAHRDLTSGLDWETQVERACRIRKHKDAGNDDGAACTGEVD